MITSQFLCQIMKHRYNFGSKSDQPRAKTKKERLGATYDEAVSHPVDNVVCNEGHDVDRRGLVLEVPQRASWITVAVRGEVPISKGKLLTSPVTNRENIPVVNEHVFDIFRPSTKVNRSPRIDDDDKGEDTPANLGEALAGEQVADGVEEND